MKVKKIGKTIRPLLPQEARKKLNSGGRHKDRKKDFARTPKHRNQNKEN